MDKQIAKCKDNHDGNGFHRGTDMDSKFDRFYTALGGGAVQSVDNLNRLFIEDADYGWSVAQTNHSVSSDDDLVQVVFKNLEHVLIELISQHEAAVGCVAWLTHLDILDALARLKSVSIVVQKEDFLRPDMGSRSDWKNLLRQKYAALPEDDRMKSFRLGRDFEHQL